MYKLMNFICVAFALMLSYTTSQAGGFIIVMPDKHQNPNAPAGVPNPALFPLESRSTKVEAQINGQTATTSIEQVFFNPSNRQLEGYFLFPVPKDVIISKFTMNINGKEHEAELLDAQKARAIYEQIVRRSKDPALLEYFGKGMFRVRIFPILPKKEQRIRLTYTETLPKDNGTIEYSFPLNTKKYSAKPIGQVSFKIDVKGQEKIKTVYCPTHETEIIRKGEKQATVGFEASNVQSDRDFKLYYNMANSKIGLSSLAYKPNDEDGYFFLNLSPGFGNQKDVVEKDIVFVMDKSGSMSGEKMEQAQKALKFCINNLNDGDRFEVVPFSTEASALFGGVKPFNKENQAKALEFIDDLRAIGGTNIEEALGLAMNAQSDKQDRPFFVIFMTDGKPTIGATQETVLLDKVKAFNKQNVRVFTFGVGTELNTHLLDKLTAMTKAHRTYVMPNEDIEVKVSDFFTKASSPILTDLEVKFENSAGVYQVYDKKMPNLFKGSTVSLMGRYKGHGKTKVTLTGKVNGKTETFSYTIDLPKQNTDLEFIPSLWASRAVGYLLDQIRLNGENEELVKEVTRLAKKHGIITPYTSFLILEDEAIAANNNRVRDHDLVLRPRALRAPSLEDDISFEEEKAVQSSAGGASKKSGRRSVEVSKENQAMNKADNLAATRQGINRLKYKDAEGKQRNLAQDIVHVQGRAMYNNNNAWVDATLAANQDKKVKRIKFNSTAYFDLISKNEKLVDFLMLGRNVRFVWGNQIYEVYEN